jgi:hypothetical protein
MHNVVVVAFENSGEEKPDERQNDDHHGDPA